MITAVDTNVLLDILVPNQMFYDVAALALQRSADEGGLVVCDVVYAELCVHFDSRKDCDAFLEGIDLQLDPLKREAQCLASRADRRYRQQGGDRTRILPDFLIGAHAQVQASRLLSRDRGFYRKLFPALEVWDPSRQHTQSKH